jgi:methylenetetrahydrofolate dehydrogenase (NADP+)/methenyltetrahydrofolate cyclohydrolase
MLGYIIVGDHPESSLYVKLKTKAADEIGIQHQGKVLKENVTEQELIDEINNLQDDNRVSGVMVQLPLPAHINSEKILNFIRPNKDVDGLNPFNIGSLALKNH